ncbi:LysR family transcriptional regulator [Eggerthella guodeyinii]|uniref:LysR family transcriptional regulator n=1 Tax=Eggerthella guodeyinii TaxID=2690837 RepID=A0A6N7RQS2_9ACTN|nr:LysR family transcriptional regulator [Eggerthella guodeyinii]MRX83715.1 LysR family transcriptional regulator [Eggerthella guodeyinii]
MNIKQIQYFAAVVEHGSLSAAAKSQHITVQAISKSMADLESEVRCDLFVRNNQGMQPTTFAKTMYEQAVPVLAQFSELETFAARYRQADGGIDRLRLALNTPPFLGNEVVRENTAALIQAQTGVETTMELATGEDGLVGLWSRAFDVLVTVGAFDHPDVECRPVGTVPSAVIMRKGHPLAAKEELALADVEPYPVATSSWFDALNDSIVSKYRAKKTNLRFVELDLAGIEQHFKSSGVIFTTGIPALEKTHGMTAVRPFVPQDSVTVPICAVYLKERSGAVEAVLQDLFSVGLASFGF